MCLPSARHSTIEVNLCHSSNIWAPKGLLVCVCVSPCFSKLSRSLATGYGLRAMGYRLWDLYHVVIYSYTSLV